MGKVLKSITGIFSPKVEQPAPPDTSAADKAAAANKEEQKSLTEEMVRSRRARRLGLAGRFSLISSGGETGQANLGTGV